MTTTPQFHGPLFVVGMPRSGTKLLRDLLNRNPGIGIPVVESHFILRLVNKFGNPPPFENPQQYLYFFKEFQKFDFFRRRKRKGIALTKEYLKKHADLTSWNSIFEHIFKYYAPPGKEKNFIWGDKCPSISYLENLIQLKNLFPEAKFLHIIRDPRDYCPSMKNVRFMTLYSAAEKWRTAVANAQQDGNKIGNDYQEVFFESLLEDPRQTLIDICDFLGIKFLNDMTSLDRPVAERSTIGAQLSIVKTNKKKYFAQLSTPEIKRIEEIAFPIIKKHYKLEFATEFKPLNPLILTMHRGYNKIFTLIRKSGIPKKLINSGLVKK